MMDEHDMTHEHSSDPLPDPGPPPGALRALDDVVAPDRLRMAISELVADAQRAQAPRRRGWLLPRPRIAGALAAVATVLLVVLAIGGGASSPSVRDAAAVALRPAAAPAPAAQPGGELLRAHAGPIVFPTWTQVGWRPVGARTDTVGGHELRTIFYADAAGRRIGYAIADAALPVSGGQIVMRRGAQLRVLDSGATAVVTWRRDGRTCILAGRGVPVGRLLTLASYAA